MKSKLANQEFKNKAVAAGGKAKDNTVFNAEKNLLEKEESFNQIGKISRIPFEISKTNAPVAPRRVGYGF